MERLKLNGSLDALEKLLARPQKETVELMERLEGDMIILGVGGKMGVSLAAMAANACREAGVAKRIIGVARTIRDELKNILEPLGVELVAADLSDYEQLAALPKVENVLYLAGRKFGETGTEPLTWLGNTVIPANTAQVFKGCRIVVFSTGCVYELKSTGDAGSTESDAPAPAGEYANSCLGRERIFEYAANQFGSKVLLYRLNYSVDLRYGVLVEVARNVFEDRPVDLNVSTFNVIWQGDAVNRALRSLEVAASPTVPLNITGECTLKTEEVASWFAKRFGKEVTFTGADSGKAYLSDASKSFELFGPCEISEDALMELVADWISHGGGGLDKPTHFSVTDGQFLDEKGKDNDG